MDVDEFLDRELVDLDLTKPDKAASEAVKEITVQKDDNLGDIPSFDDVNTHLMSGDIEKAEQAYLQLWYALVSQKLKWNKEIYDKLLALSRQFSFMMSKAYSDTKRKSENIHELLGKATVALREGKKNVSFKIYSEVGIIDNSIPNVFFEEKKVIWEQMMDFYKELKTVTDNELIKRVSSLVVEINLILEKINISISQKDFKEAAKGYAKCVELYNQVPEGFLTHKNSIGIRILEIYKLLSIQSEISSLQGQLPPIPTAQPLQPQEVLHPPMPDMKPMLDVLKDAPNLGAASLKVPMNKEDIKNFLRQPAGAIIHPVSLTSQTSPTNPSANSARKMPAESRPLATRPTQIPKKDIFADFRPKPMQPMQEPKIALKEDSKEPSKLAGLFSRKQEAKLQTPRKERKKEIKLPEDSIQGQAPDIEKTLEKLRSYTQK